MFHEKSNHRSNCIENEEDFLLKVHRMLTCPAFLKLEDYLCSANMYSILGRTNQEDWYSHFIAWLLNPDAGHHLGSFPLKCFLSMVRRKCYELKRGDCADDVGGALRHLPPQEVVDIGEFVESCVMPDCRNKELDRELTICKDVFAGKKDGRLDIAMTSMVKMPDENPDDKKERRLLLVIENKVCHEETQFQTKL